MTKNLPLVLAKKNHKKKSYPLSDPWFTPNVSNMQVFTLFSSKILIKIFKIATTRVKFQDVRDIYPSSTSIFPTCHVDQICIYVWELRDLKSSKYGESNQKMVSPNSKSVKKQEELVFKVYRSDRQFLRKLEYFLKTNENFSLGCPPERKNDVPKKIFTLRSCDAQIIRSVDCREQNGKLSF